MQQNIPTSKLTLNSATIFDFKAAFGFADAAGIKRKYKETKEWHTDAKQKSRKAALIQVFQHNEGLTGCCYSLQLSLHTHVPQCSSFPLARLSLIQANKLYQCFIVFMCNKSSPFSALQLVYTRFTWQPYWTTAYTSLQRKVEVFPKCQTHSSLFPWDAVPLCYLQGLTKFSTLKINSYAPILITPLCYYSLSSGEDGWNPTIRRH